MFTLILAAALALPSPPPGATPPACAGKKPPVASSAAPLPCPSASPLPTIGTTSTTGRKANLVGTATAASEGSIDQEQIANRPAYRPGEVLEDIPGLVISQHSGEGKANQYYLRGFQLDHGTDLDGTIAGVPVNLPTHAHGQGYSDINWLIPELVSDVEYKKGPYYADQGDFSTAGDYVLSYRNTIAPTFEAAAGNYGFDRLLVADSPQFGAGHLLYALELSHDNGPFDKPDEYGKFNGVLRWSRLTASTDFNVTAWGYHGSFNSTDQIPQRLVDAGVLDRFGAFDPSDGGTTYRYALSSELVHKDDHGTTRLSAYGFTDTLQLFSNFQYDLNDATDFYNVTGNPVTCAQVYGPCNAALTDYKGTGKPYTGPRVGTLTSTGTYTSYCPGNQLRTNGATAPGSVPVSASEFAFSCGDQLEQDDQRFVSGFNASRSFGDGGRLQTVAGVGLRNDNIGTVGLFLTKDRVPYPDGVLSDDHVVERDIAAYVQSQLEAGAKLRLIGGLRADAYDFRVFAPQTADSGHMAATLVSPKLQAAYAFGRRQEAYLGYGESFHSNDARGIFQTLDPQTHATFDASGNSVQPVVPLVRARGYEAGYRYSGTKLVTTVAVWRLDLDSELVFDGDNGTTAPAGPTRRKGIELTNFYAPTRYLTIDADIATSTAHFLTNPANEGIFVPESLNVVSTAGITLDKPSFAASVRLRYFGPRTLNQLGTAVSSPSSLLSAQYVRKLGHGHRLIFDMYNILNAQSDDVEYYYNSWVKQDAANPAYANNPTINPALGGAGVPDYTFHPSEKRTVRLTYAAPL